MPAFALKSRRVVLGDGIVEATVVVRDGRIAAVDRGAGEALSVPVEDLGDLPLLPGFVDCHAHVNEPGRTEWEGFETATAAAATGGITTLVDMPLNSLPPTTTEEALAVKAAAAEGACAVDYGFWGGVVPGNTGELAGMVHAGALGFKAFLCDSGVPEFPPASRDDLDAAMPVLADLGVPLLVHAELPGPGEDGAVTGDGRAYARYLESRPSRWEDDAIRLMIDLCDRHRCRVHIVHLSSADALDDLRRAKDAGLPVTVETCPHYLVFSAEEIPDGATPFKCAPPIRHARNRERLWEGLIDGTIDCVVSDHSPCTPALKRLEEGDFGAAWGGIASLQLSPSLVFTEAARRGHDLSDLVQWMCRSPARLCGLEGRKGAIAPGADADLSVFDTEAAFEVTPDRLRHRHPVTPYAGRMLKGRVRAVWLRGRPAVVDGEVQGPPSGIRLVPGRSEESKP